MPYPALSKHRHLCLLENHRQEFSSEISYTYIHTYIYITTTKEDDGDGDNELCLPNGYAISPTYGGLYSEVSSTFKDLNPLFLLSTCCTSSGRNNKQLYSRSHKTVEQFWHGRDLKDYLVPIPLPWPGNPVSESHVLPAKKKHLTIQICQFILSVIQL